PGPDWGLPQRQQHRMTIGVAVMQHMRAASDRHCAPLRRGDLAQGGGNQRHGRAAPSAVMLSRGGVQGNCFRSMTMPVCNPGMKVVCLYCDEMLTRLGRRLRAAGYDTAIAESGLADTRITAQGGTDARVVPTR